MLERIESAVLGDQLVFPCQQGQHPVRRRHDQLAIDRQPRITWVERKLDEAEGRVEAFDLGQRKTLAEEIAALEAESAIEAELESLKDRIAARDKR